MEPSKISTGNFFDPEQGRMKSVIPLITTRERQVMQKLCEGLTAKEIAQSLHLSAHTIISHKKNLQYKLAARNTVHLIVKAIRLNLISI